MLGITHIFQPTVLDFSAIRTLTQPEAVLVLEGRRNVSRRSTSTDSLSTSTERSEYLWVMTRSEREINDHSASEAARVFRGLAEARPPATQAVLYRVAKHRSSRGSFSTRLADHSL